MNLDIHGARIYYTIPVLGGIPITETVVNMFIVSVLIVLLCLFLTHNMQVHARTKRQIIAEWIVKTVNRMVGENMGSRFSDGNYPALMATIMGLSALCSLSSMVGMYAPTSDLSMLLGWSVVVFVLITYTKLRTNGLGKYVLSFFKPVPFFAPMNLFSEVATPVAMAFRHFGNIASGSVITALLYGALASLSAKVFGMIPGVVGQLLGQVPILQVGIPAIFSIYFDVFSSCLQAFIFCMLTMMNIAQAAEE